MPRTPRTLGDRVVRGLAWVGLVWALAVLAALLMLTAAHGQETDGGYAPALAGSHTDPRPAPPAGSAASTPERPRAAGAALTLTILTGGVVVLLVGATRPRQRPQPPPVPLPVPLPVPAPVLAGPGPAGHRAHPPATGHRPADLRLLTPAALT